MEPRITRPGRSALTQGKWQVHDKCMAVKTITIDMAAYNALSRVKKAGQSFSDVIKAHFGPQPTAGRFLERVRAVRSSEDALDRMDDVVRSRALHKARAVRL
jgi:predicted CopG family antitoxin